MRILSITIFTLFLFSACKKMEVEAPAFDVSLPKTTYKVGDTVRFTLSGDPDFITFYSGEPGLNYEARARTSEAGTPRLQFTTYQQNVGQTGTLRLMASTAFSGMADSTNVAAATWTDITSRAVLSTGADNTSSGNIDLSDFLTAGKPLYLAFRYAGYFHATLKQPTWTVKSFNVTNTLSDSSVSTITAIGQTGWTAVNMKNASVVWTVPTSGQVAINGTATGSVNTDNDDWVISKPLDLKKVVPDVGVSIKSLNGNKLTTYTYIFKKAGTFKPTFLAFNNNIDAQKEVVKTLSLTITP